MKAATYAVTTLIVALATFLPVVTEAKRPKDTKIEIEPREFDWPSEVPAGCPFPPVLDSSD